MKEQKTQAGLNNKGDVLAPATGKALDWAGLGRWLGCASPSSVLLGAGFLLRLVLRGLQDTHVLIATTVQEILEKEGKLSPNYPANLPLCLTGLTWGASLLWSLRTPQ